MRGVRCLSRSALVERCNRLLALAPISYLALWRLQPAAQALQSSDGGIASIAADDGYESEEAFSRAFKCHAGRFTIGRRTKFDRQSARQSFP